MEKEKTIELKRGMEIKVKDKRRRGLEIVRGIITGITEPEDEEDFYIIELDTGYRLLVYL